MVNELGYVSDFCCNQLDPEIERGGTQLTKDWDKKKREENEKLFYLNFDHIELKMVTMIYNRLSIALLIAKNV